MSEAIELRDEDNYALTALSSSGNSFTISKASGVTSRTCSAAGVSTGGLQRHQLVSRLAYPSIPAYGGYGREASAPMSNLCNSRS